MAFTHFSIYHEEHEGHEESRGKDESGHPATKESDFPSFFSIPTGYIFHLALLHKEFFMTFMTFMVNVHGNRVATPTHENIAFFIL